MDSESLIERAFSAERAEGYDAEFAALHAVKDLMHLMLRVHFASLPDDARILVAGAGTGAEVRVLAPIFPRWTFTLVDPAAGMLAVAERHAKAEGFADRCAFHHGYVASLPEDAHDAATSVLVSHFLTDASARRAYFADIAARLKPGARLFNADLAADRDDPAFPGAMDLWLAMQQHAVAARRGGHAAKDHAPKDPAASFREYFGKIVAAHGPAEVEAMIRQAGFTDVVPCYQAVLIRGWVATRAS